MINFDVIQPLDIVCTTSLSWLADGIRMKEAGVKNCFNTRICSHVGIVVPVRESPRMLSIAEMLGDGLHLSSFAKYENKGYLGERIVDIKRFLPFKEFENTIINQILNWWEEGKKYDYEGMLKNLFPFLKDKDGKFYCSEMLEYLALEYTHTDLLDFKHPNDDNVTPYDIQKSKLSTSINWRK